MYFINSLLLKQLRENLRQGIVLKVTDEDGGNGSQWFLNGSMAYASSKKPRGDRKVVLYNSLYSSIYVCSMCCRSVVIPSFTNSWLGCGLHRLLGCGLGLLAEGRGFRRRGLGLDQRDLLLVGGGGDCRRTAGGGGGGGRSLNRAGGSGRSPAEAACDLVEGLALRLGDFEVGEDEEEDEEDGEDDEDPRATPLLMERDTERQVIRKH